MKGDWEDYDSMSDSDDGGGDVAAHAKLLADIVSQSLTKKKRTMGAVEGSRLRWASHGSKGVDESALATFSKNALQPLYAEEALPKSKQEGRRIARSEGYKRVAEESNKWEKLVDKQRTARQVRFPLVTTQVTVHDADKNYKPGMKTQLEREMYELLNEAKLSKPVEETEEQKEQRLAMSLEEVRERNKESYRLRLFKEKIAKKAQLQNKSKSKKFHKILQKERFKKEVSELEQLQKSAPEKAVERMQKLDDVRVEERMSLKHKKSKWAKNLQPRTKTDKRALAALQENSRLHKELVAKVKSTSEEKQQKQDDSSGSEDSSDEEDQAEVVTSNSEPAPGVESQSYGSTKKFWGEWNKQATEQVREQLEARRKLRQSQPSSADVLAIEEADEIVKNKINILNYKQSKRNKRKRNSDESDDDSTEEELNEKPTITQYECNFSSVNKPDISLVETVERLTTLEDCDAVQSDTTKKFAPGSLKLTKEDNNFTTAPTAINDVPELLVKELAFRSHGSIGDALEDSDSDDDDMDIFDAKDRALEVFEEEKKKAEEANALKDVSHALPGWGDWTGPGIEMTEFKKQRFLEKAPKRKPSKFDKSNVIYNEKADMHKNIRDRMVTELPYPFLRVEDYEASIRGPVSNTFVPVAVHKQLIQPSVKTKLGTVIKPMDQNQLLKDPEVMKAVNKKLMEKESQLPQKEKSKGRKKKDASKSVIALAKKGIKIKKFSRRTTAAKINK